MGQKDKPSGRDWIVDYERGRQDPENRRMHLFGLPLVAVGLLMLLWPLEFMISSQTGTTPIRVPLLLVMTSAVYAALISVPLALGMTLIALPLLLVLDTLSRAGMAMGPSGAALIAAGWLLLLRGHRHEGKRPYWLGRLQHLPVGLLWLLARLFNRLGLPW